MLAKQLKPVSALEIQKKLLQKKITANKTTVYRELSFLKKQNIILELQFGDRTKRYELISTHHHHIICTNCDKVEDVELKKDLATAEKMIAKNKKFAMIRHSLEFYGVCRACVKK